MSDDNPLTVPDTDWGRALRQVSASHNRRFDGMERRQIALEKRMNASDIDRSNMRLELRSNTDITKSIKNDTAAIVFAVRFGRSIRGFLTWTSPVIAAAAAVFAAWITWWSRK